MAVVFDAVGSGTAKAASLTFSHTCTGSDLVLLVWIASRFNDVTGATYNTVAMTSMGASQANTGANSYLFGFYLANPATGPNNVVISAASSGFLAAGSVSFTGVNQTTPVTGYTTANGSSTTPSVTAGGTPGSDDMISDGVAGRVNAASTTTAGADQTEQWDVLAVAGDANQQSYGSTQAGSVSPATMSWTVGTSMSWAAGAVVVEAAAAGGGGSDDLSGGILRSRMREW